MPRAVRLLAVLAAVVVCGAASVPVAAAPAHSAQADRFDFERDCAGWEWMDQGTARNPNPDYVHCERVADQIYEEELAAERAREQAEEEELDRLYAAPEPEPSGEDEESAGSLIVGVGGAVAIVAFCVWLGVARSRGRTPAPAAPRERPRRTTSTAPAPQPEPRKRPKLPPVDDALREVAEADLVSLGEQLGEMEIEVDLPTTPEAARAAYHEAVGSYQLASQQAERATAIEELHTAARTVATGRFRLQVAQALIAGEEPPRNAAPCFFDPRHGVSAGEVGWTTLVVPACAGCRDRAITGGVAEPLTIADDGVPGPYWEKPLWDAYYAGAQPAFARAVEDDDGLLFSMFRRVQ